MSARQRANCAAPRLARARIVGDVVDGAAERIDFEHRLALRARQNAHAQIERAAGGALGRRSGFVHSRTPRLLRRGGETPAEPPGRAAQNADQRQAGNGGHGKMHALAQRIARHRGCASGDAPAC